MTEEREPSVRDRVGEPVAIRPGKLQDLGPRPLVVRFLAGALTSIVAGVLTLALGARAAGVMLAFPAILAASLTLIEEEEDSVEAREDARGAVLGGLGMAAFAGVAALAFPRLSGAVSLILATAAWIAVAVGGYALVWSRRR